MITPFGHLIRSVIFMVGEFGERIEPICMERSETSRLLSGDGISLDLFTLTPIVRQEALVFS